MSKTNTIILRTSKELKRRIEKIAKITGCINESVCHVRVDQGKPVPNWDR